MNICLGFEKIRKFYDNMIALLHFIVKPQRESHVADLRYETFTAKHDENNSVYGDSKPLAGNNETQRKISGFRAITAKMENLMEKISEIGQHFRVSKQFS